MVTFWEIATHSVGRKFSFIMFICSFGPVPGHCLPFTLLLYHIVKHYSDCSGVL